MQATESDHKPVISILDVNIAVVNEAERRKIYGLIQETNEEVKRAKESSLASVPSVTLSSSYVLLNGRNSAVLNLKNESTESPAIFTLHSDGSPKDGKCGCELDNHGYVVEEKGPRPNGGFPFWLQVSCSLLFSFFRTVVKLFISLIILGPPPPLPLFFYQGGTCRWYNLSGRGCKDRT